MIIDSYDINSEPIVKLENFYGEKQHLVKKCMVIFSKVTDCRSKSMQWKYTGLDSAI